jgi:hypothetical protein
MNAPGELRVRALDALVRWRAPAHLLAELRRGPLGRLVATDDFAPTVEVVFAWSDHNGGIQCVNGDEHVVAPTMRECLAEAMIVVNRYAARSVEADLLTLHAGVVVVPDGQAVALCGHSGAGKSTATAAAVLAGHGFLADEVCAVHPESHLVRPYLRPIGLRAGGAAAIGVHIEGASALWVPPSVHAADAPLGLIALVERRPGAATVTRLDAPAALERLADHTLVSDAERRRAFRRLADLVRRVPVVALGYEHATDAVGHLTRWQLDDR